MMVEIPVGLARLEIHTSPHHRDMSRVHVPYLERYEIGFINKDMVSNMQNYYLGSSSLYLFLISSFLKLA